jgi:hypothetical protein
VGATVKVLQAKGLSVHCILGTEGDAHWYLDPVGEYGLHAGVSDKGSCPSHNLRSVGIEMVNPYYPVTKAGVNQERQAKEAGYGPAISAIWAHRGRYLVPPQAQCEALWRRIRKVMELCPDIPPEFPGAKGGLFRWGRIERHTVPGIMAHHRWHHSDGLFPEHYCFLRVVGYEPSHAYEVTLKMASSGMRTTPLPREVG